MTAITWSGYTWNVRTGAGGPGPNNWSDSPADVFVDANGKLHLTINNHGGQWYCTEIWSNDTFGYGTYTFNMAAQSTQMDSNAVLGFFTYLDDFHEIDIEYSKWSNPYDVNNCGFTVQPSSAGAAHNSYRFYIPMNVPTSNKFTWVPGKVNFLSKTSSTSVPWTDTLNIPQSSTEKVHINLWLYNGSAPITGPQEIVLDSFNFTPETGCVNLGIACVPESYLIYGALGAIVIGAIAYYG